jgi:hypothetical protein
MRTRWIRWSAVTLIALQLVAAAAQAAERENAIRTDRLSPKQLKTWKSIESIVIARDTEGQPLHPKLYSLWQQIATSGLDIWIEFAHPPNLDPNEAGRFILDDSDGQEPQAVIRLQLPLIEKAKVDQLAEGFVPFRGLNKHERYVEVLAHELAHAVSTLESPQYASMVKEFQVQQKTLIKELHEFIWPGNQAAGEKAKLECKASVDALRASLDALSENIEGPARLAEAAVWQELHNSQALKNRSGR